MKKLFHMLMPYLNKKLYFDRAYCCRKDGKLNIACAFCGNIANAVGVVTIGKSEFNLPVCKPHVERYLKSHPNNPANAARYFPFKFKLNLKNREN